MSAPSGEPTDEPAGSLDGLVLLDLPDFDSREMSHRSEAERVLELVDVFVWVTDPQKYADALLHDEYVRQLTRRTRPSRSSCSTRSTGCSRRAPSRPVERTSSGC